MKARPQAWVFSYSVDANSRASTPADTRFGPSVFTIQSPGPMLSFTRLYERSSCSETARYSIQRSPNTSKIAPSKVAAVESTPYRAVGGSNRDLPFGLQKLGPGNSCLLSRITVWDGF